MLSLRKFGKACHKKHGNMAKLTLQKAFGKRPLSTFCIARWTSSFFAETPVAKSKIY